MYSELAEINGIKPKIVLEDGEEKEAKSASSSSVYKMKKTSDHYYCNCPAWRNQKGILINARTCKHLQELLGSEYELERIKLKNPDGSSSKIAGAQKESATKKRKKFDDEEEAVNSKPASKRAKQSVSKGNRNKGGEEEEDLKPVRRTASKRNAKVQDDNDEDRSDNNDPVSQWSKHASCSGVKEQSRYIDNKEMASPSESHIKSNFTNGDELAEINGIKPAVYLTDGEEKEVKSMTSSAMYKIKRTWDHYYCTCPAWRNQGGVPVNARSCKHIQSLLGSDYEAVRVKMRNPEGVALNSSSRPSRNKIKSTRPGSTNATKTVEVLLANKWDLEKGPDPTGWWISEKLDGIRAFYDGKSMYSRLGNLFTPPKWFLDKLPKNVTLDGELFSGRGQFASTVSIVKSINSPRWSDITFQVFDIPSSKDQPFEKRMEKLKYMFGPGKKYETAAVVLVEHEKAQSRQHVMDKLKHIEKLGGEGLMLREPGSQYEGRRSGTLLKIKTFYDAEALVTGYVPGKGKHTGTMGALQCTMESGKTFAVGTGFSDKQRKNPPKIGSIITYRFQEISKSGHPRFPSFIGEAIDKAGPKDVEIPEHRKVSSVKDEEE